MKKIQKSDNKGFTLVELIVVIVILAILAAILVPALLGYIDKAKQQQSVLNAKSALTAAQAEMSTLYAKGAAPTDIDDADENYIDDILDTADVKANCTLLIIGCGDTSANKSHSSYTINYVMYQETGMTDPIIFDGSSWDKSNKKDTSKVKETYAIVGEEPTTTPTP